MTDDSLPLAELLQKAGDADFLRAVAEAVLQLLMEADVEGLVGAGRHERSPERLNYRNGHRERALDTRLGTLQLRVPKLRQGGYFPPFLEPRKVSEKALVAVIQEAWVGGVSTRRVAELVQAMGLSGIGKSTVSKLCEDIDERVDAFLGRPLQGEWPYLWLDATYLKVREGGRIVSVAAIIAVAVDAEGRREIVGLGLGPSEAEPFWSLSSGAAQPQGLGPARPQRGEAGRLGRPRRAQARHREGARRRLAALPRPLDEERARPRAQGAADGGRGRAPPGVPAARPGGRAPSLAASGGPAPPPLAQARGPHGRERARRAGLHGVPRPAPDQAALHEPARAPQQGGEAPRRRGRVGSSAPNSPPRPRSCG
jgi:Transposase, Mutator family